MTIFEPKIHDRNATLGPGVGLVNPENGDDEGDLYESSPATHWLCDERTSAALPFSRSLKSLSTLLEADSFRVYSLTPYYSVIGAAQSHRFRCIIY
jgi:hypothetical protein